MPEASPKPATPDLAGAPAARFSSGGAAAPEPGSAADVEELLEKVQAGAGQMAHELGLPASHAAPVTAATNTRSLKGSHADEDAPSATSGADDLALDNDALLAQIAEQALTGTDPTSAVTSAARATGEEPSADPVADPRSGFESDSPDVQPADRADIGNKADLASLSASVAAPAPEPVSAAPEISIDDAVQAAIADAQTAASIDASAEAAPSAETPPPASPTVAPTPEPLAPPGAATAPVVEQPVPAAAIPAPQPASTPELAAPAPDLTADELAAATAAALAATQPAPETPGQKIEALGPASEPPSPASKAAPATIAELDSKLAMTAAAAVDSDFADPADLSPAAAAPAKPVAAPAPQTEARPAAPAPATAPAPPAAKPKGPNKLVLLIERPLRPLAVKLAALPPVVTQTIGWAGVCTLFWAGIVWLNAIVFMGPPKPPTAEHEDAHEVIGAPGPDGKPIQPKPHKPKQAHGKDDGHAAPAGGHGQPAKGSHADAGKPAAGGEHSGGH